MRIHIVIGLFLISAFSLLLWQLNSTTGANSFTKVAFAQSIPTVCPLNVEGDANCDGKIDGADYSLWKSHFKGEKIAGDSDFNDDQKIDMKDFEIWRRGMLKPTSGAPTTTVNPTITDTIDGCQCDQGTVTENNCSKETGPVCTGRYSCTCQAVNQPTATSTPPPGCYYEEVTCVKAPCYPVLICPTPTIAPTGTSRNTPTPPTGSRMPACSECGSNFAEKQDMLCGGQINCVGTQSCQESQATCTVNGVTNPNCFKAECVSISDI